MEKNNNSFNTSNVKPNEPKEQVAKSLLPGHDNNNKQLGWNCFDIAVGIKNRGELINYALDNASNAEFRKLLAPEIRHAGMLTYAYMVSKQAQNEEHINKIIQTLKIADELNNKADDLQIEDYLNKLLDKKENSSDLTDLARHALPPNMHSHKLFGLFKNYLAAHENERVKAAVSECRAKLLAVGIKDINSLGDIDNFFYVNENKTKFKDIYENFFRIRQKEFEPAKLKLQSYCQNEDIYRNYINSYYSNHGWFSFQREFKNECTTSMIDIAARFLESVIIIYTEENSEKKEIYRTKNNGLREIKILYVNNNHFTEYNATKIESLQKQPHEKQTAENIHPSTSYKKLLQPGYLTSLEITERSTYQNLPGGFAWNSIPMFSVITGKNGVGKSQLLQAILYGLTPHQTSVKLVFQPGERPQICSLENTSSLNSLRKEVEDVSKKELQKEYDEIFNDLKKYALSKIFNSEKTNFKYPNNQAFYDEIINSAIQSIQEENNNFSFIVIENRLKLQFDKKTIPHIADYNSIDQSAKLTFNTILEKNLLNKDRKTAVKETFNKINEYLIQNNFKYIFSEKSFDWNINSGEFEKVRLEFAKPHSQIFLSGLGYGQLSSGEKIVLLVLLWKLSQHNSSKKGIIIFDEPDAHLHPSQVKEIIDILKEKLVQELNLQVIMTTHNPTTISFVPPECIFMLENEAPDFKPNIKPVTSKQQAINILSGNLVYVNEPFAIVFVEGAKDKLFYTNAAKRLNDAQILDFQVIFKVHGAGKNNELASCSVVDSLVKKLVDPENLETSQPLSQFIFGLIDGDNKKHENKRNLKSLTRYSVENYIFDPINLFLCLHYIYNRCKDDQDLSKEMKDFVNFYDVLAKNFPIFYQPIENIINQSTLQNIIETVSKILIDELKKALQFREKNYGTLEEIINEQIAACEAILNNSDNKDEFLYKLIIDIIKNPSNKYLLLKQYFATLQLKTEQKIQNTNHDIFNLALTFIVNEENEIFNENFSSIKKIIYENSNRKHEKIKEITLLIKNYLDKINIIAKNKKQNDWNDLKNALAERDIKIMNKNSDIDWNTNKIQKVRYIFKNREILKIDLIYPLILLYFRGHNLQTCYEHIFNIPHELANEFHFIFDITQSILIPEDLYKIFSSMKHSIEEDTNSKNTKIYSTSGDIPFFKKIKDSIEQNSKREQKKILHDQARSKQEKSGIDDEILEDSMGALFTN